jgi:hypothetical protein
MKETQVVKLNNLSAPIGVQVLPAHDKEEGVTIADEADEVLEPSFQTCRSASRIVVKVALLAFQPKPCRLNVLRADHKFRWLFPQEIAATNAVKVPSKSARPLRCSKAPVEFWKPDVPPLRHRNHHNRSTPD